MGIGMVESMLEPYMKEETHATQEQVGLTFMIYNLVYTLGSPLAGYVRYIGDFFIIIKK